MPKHKSKTDLTVELVVAQYEHSYGAQLDKKQVKRVLFSLAGIVRNFAELGEAGDLFSLPNILTLELRDQPARVRRNPKTGDKVNLPAGRKLHVRFAKPLRRLDGN